jgi:hypothetical protein
MPNYSLIPKPELHTELQIESPTVRSIGERPQFNSNSSLISVPDTKAITQFSGATIDDAVNLVVSDANKINHLFPAKHNLDGLVNQFGGQKNLIIEVLNTSNGKFPANGIFKDIPVNIGGKTIFIRGNVTNNVPRIGTMYVP